MMLNSDVWMKAYVAALRSPFLTMTENRYFSERDAISWATLAANAAVEKIQDIEEVEKAMCASASLEKAEGT